MVEPEEDMVTSNAPHPPAEEDVPHFAEEANTASKATMDRSLAAKMYIEQYYINLVQNAKDRGNRFVSLSFSLSPFLSFSLLFLYFLFFISFLYMFEGLKIFIYLAVII